MFSGKMNVRDLKHAVLFYLATLVCEVLNVAREAYSSKKGEKVTNKLPLNLNLSFIIKINTVEIRKLSNFLQELMTITMYYS